MEIQKIEQQAEKYAYQHYPITTVKPKELIDAYLAGASAMNGSAGVQWVDVKTNLPKEAGRYWCYVYKVNDFGISDFQRNCRYNPEDKRWSDNFETMQVTHWMPLPSPPDESVSFPSQQVGSAGVHTSIDALNVKPTICERFADNGAHSHWDLIDTETGGVLWTEDSESVSSPSPRTNSAGVPSSILRMNDTWPLSDVLKHLIEGTQILLEKRNYDGPTYEQMEICVKVGNEIRELLAQSSPSPLEAETADKK